MSLGDATISGLRKWIAEEQTHSMALMAAGQCADFTAYRYSVGYIQALHDVDKVIGQIQDELMKG